LDIWFYKGSNIKNRYRFNKRRALTLKDVKNGLNKRIALTLSSILEFGPYFSYVLLAHKSGFVI
jgi:hypothetical protein